METIELPNNFKLECLGKKLNNPFNIRYNSRNHWIGQQEPHGGFCRFESLYFGYRAGVKLLTGTSYRGKSIREIITRYAPPFENATELYINYVTKSMETSPEYVMPSLAPTNNRIWHRLCNAITTFETSYHISYRQFCKVIDSYRSYPGT